MESFHLKYFKHKTEPRITERESPYTLQIENIAYKFTDGEKVKSLVIIGNATARQHAVTYLQNWICQDHPNGISKLEVRKLLGCFNGIYLILYMDSKQKILQLINDFLGFYPLYVYEHSDFMGFTNSVHSLYNTPGMRWELDQSAIINYVYNGHLLNDQSWLKGLTRSKPAMMYCFDLANHQTSQQHYWSWSHIGTKQNDKERLIQKYSSLFERSITNLDISPNAKSSIGLSGGLDSRWIASLAGHKYNLKALCFASSENWELKLSRKVASILGIPHQYHPISYSNWLEDRLELLWSCDGCLHLGHLHEGKKYHEFLKKTDYYFHGFYGGGIYASPSTCNQKMDQHLAHNWFQSEIELEDSHSEYLNFPSIDPYIAYQKIRHQSAYSVYLLSLQTKVVIPFYDLDWMECNYAIDDHLQLNSKFYLEVLNRSMLPTLLNIPWQRTGIKPSHVWLNRWLLAGKWPGVWNRVANSFGQNRHFMNYHALDNTIQNWLNAFEKEIQELALNFPLTRRENKLRMLSLVLWLKMLQQNTAHVL